MFNDIGRFVGRYLQLLACVSVVSMIISAFWYDAVNIDLTFILLLWGAEHLIKHNPTARRWMIGLLGVMLASMVALILVAVFGGTESMTIRFGGSKIEHPSLETVSMWAGISAVVAGIPFGLLLTPKARKEFWQSADRVEEPINARAAATDQG